MTRKTHKAKVSRTDRQDTRKTTSIWEKKKKIEAQSNSRKRILTKKNGERKRRKNQIEGHTNSKNLKDKEISRRRREQ